MTEETPLQKEVRKAARERLENTLLFYIHAAGLPEPEREYRFHAFRRFRFDFCWPEKQVAAECEGGIWANGRHTRGQGFQDDCVKYNTAALLGFRVFRFTDEMIESGEALSVLCHALRDDD